MTKDLETLDLINKGLLSYYKGIFENKVFEAIIEDMISEKEELEKKLSWYIATYGDYFAD